MEKTLHVLLVEDNPADVDLIRFAIRRHARFELDHVSRLSDALARLDVQVVDVILLDLSLPDSIDLESVAKIRERSPELPIVVLTGLDDEAIAIEALGKGAQDYLLKGLSGDTIARSILYAIERRKIQSTLERSEARLAEAQEIAQLGSWEWDLVADRHLWSSQLYRILAIEPEQEASYDLFCRRLYPDDREKVIETLQAARREMKSFSLEHRILRPNGSVRVLQSRGRFTANPSGQLMRLTMTEQDITDRKRAEQELEKQTILYENLLRAQSEIGNGIVILEDGRVQYANEAFSKISGYTSEAARELSLFLEMIATDARASLLEHLRTQNNTGARNFPAETVLLHKGGGRVPLKYVMKSMHLGERTQVLAIFEETGRSCESGAAPTKQFD